MSRTLLVTNDWPPRPGGIQTFLEGLGRRLPPGELVVLASTWRGAEAADAAYPHPVERVDTRVLLPTPAVLRRARSVAAAHGCDTVWFGAAVPLGLLASRLAADGLRPAVATTHGHEVGWALVPGARQALQTVGSAVDAVTVLGDYTRERLGAALGDRAPLVPLTPGVDPAVFSPAVDGTEVRRRHGLGADQPVVVCVSRLMPRKGQDVLVRTLPALRRRVPGAALLLVGGGPLRGRLEQAARDAGVADAVRLTGSVPQEELPAHYAAGDVFAMPCRTRLGGADVEGLGIVYLEAAACGLPVVAGRSGGAPDTVLEDETGLVVDGRDDDAVVDAVAGLLADPERARRLGGRGREEVHRRWTWEAQASVLRDLLAAPPAPAARRGPTPSHARRDQLP